MCLLVALRLSALLLGVLRLGALPLLIVCHDLQILNEALIS